MSLKISHNAALKTIADKQNEERSLPTFYGQKLDSRNITKIYIKASVLADWLNDKGYRSFNGQFIQVTDGIAATVTEKDMFKECLRYVKSFCDEIVTSHFIQAGASLIISQKGTALALGELEEPFLRDTADTAYFFYQNGVVSVRKSKVNILPFGEIEGIIWKEKIKDRNFQPLPKKDYESSMFHSFMINITDNPQHLISLRSGLGYLMHRYKTPTNVKALIVNDISLATDGLPQGGTGKGICLKAVGHMVNVTILNGKNFNFKNDRFAMQNVALQTDVVYIDDADRNLDFEQFFSMLSENTEIERKHRDKLQIPFKDSPKTAMTTNYAIKGISSSYLRRKQDVFINGHYSHTHTPFDDFKCEFFHQWDEQEWLLFDNLMVSCVQEFLNEGLTEYATEELREKMLINQTSPEFWEAMETEFGNPYTEHQKGSLRSAMEFRNPAYRNTSFKKIKNWIDMYAAHKGYDVEHKERTGTGYTYELKVKDVIGTTQKTPEELFVQEGEEMLDF